MLLLQLSYSDLNNVEKIQQLSSYKEVAILLSATDILEEDVEKIAQMFPVVQKYFHGYTKISNTVSLVQYMRVPREYRFYSPKEKEQYKKVLDFFVFTGGTSNVVFHSYDAVLADKTLFEAGWNSFYLSDKNQGILWWKATPDKQAQILYENYLKDADREISILDVWCGTWVNSAFFVYRWFHQIKWIDISQDAIISAKETHPSITFEYKNLLDEVWMYDCVFDGGCLHVNPLSTQVEVLKKYKQLLKSWWYLSVRYFRGSPSFSWENIAIINTMNNLPVYGIQEYYIHEFFRDFHMVSQVFDEAYGDYGCFYLLLKKLW